ncbi:hypothetical protein HYV31_03005 [candidate division WWE3 bacterium]|nr:hypothetical protein [candidate division WWE3 bacterium]
MTSVVPPWYKEIADLAKTSPVLSDEEKRQLSELLENPVLMEMNFNKPEKLDKFRRVLTNELSKLIHEGGKFWVYMGNIRRNQTLTPEESTSLNKLINLLHLWGVAHHIK